MVYDLNHVLKEMKKRASLLFSKDFTPLFMIVTFKLRLPLPPCEDFIYYVSCFTMIKNEEEIDKAIEVYSEVFEAELVIDFKLIKDYFWQPPQKLIESLDELLEKIDEAGREFEEKIRRKLPEEIRGTPIAPSEGPITITVIFQDNNLTFGINLTEDYHRIEKETIKALLKHLRPTSKILGYTLEVSNLMKREPEINSYHIENGFIHIELKHNEEEAN